MGHFVEMIFVSTEDSVMHLVQFCGLQSLKRVLLTFMFLLFYYSQVAVRHNLSLQSHWYNSELNKEK